jgi:hypothetical protein
MRGHLPHLFHTPCPGLSTFCLDGHLAEFVVGNRRTAVEDLNRLRRDWRVSRRLRSGRASVCAMRAAAKRHAGRHAQRNEPVQVRPTPPFHPSGSWHHWFPVAPFLRVETSLRPLSKTIFGRHRRFPVRFEVTVVKIGRVVHFLTDIVSAGSGRKPVLRCARETDRGDAAWLRAPQQGREKNAGQRDRPGKLFLCRRHLAVGYQAYA